MTRAVDPIASTPPMPGPTGDGGSGPAWSSLRCSACDKPIGVYEPVACRDPDSEIRDAAYLEIRASWPSLDPRTRFYHGECSPGAAEPR